MSRRFSCFPSLDKSSFCELIFLEQLRDDLEVPGAREVDRVFVPLLELLKSLPMFRAIDVAIKINKLAAIPILQMHTLEAHQHEVALEHAAAELDEPFIKGGWQCMRILLDGGFARIRIDGRACQNKRTYFCWETCRIHCREPSPLAY